MLDIDRLKRIRLNRYPLVQRMVGHVLQVNRYWAPGFEIEVENAERIPDGPVIYAMNHTDRYNYFPFQVWIWRSFNRFTATWVKGKYYENWFVGSFMEKTNQLPTISRGYIISKDFFSAVGRPPTPVEYEAARKWVDAAIRGEGRETVPESEALPEALLSTSRDVLGYRFCPDQEDWPSYVNSTFRLMMERFVELNEEALRVGLDVLIFPQGTRSKRLLPGHIGLSQIALHTRAPVVPVGCNGCDGLYPGGSPWAKKGRVLYRIGEPIQYSDVAAMHIHEPYAPFTPDSETRHLKEFEDHARLVTDRIDELLDEPYRRKGDSAEDATSGVERFL